MKLFIESKLIFLTKESNETQKSSTDENKKKSSGLKNKENQEYTREHPTIPDTVSSVHSALSQASSAEKTPKNYEDMTKVVSKHKLIIDALLIESPEERKKAIEKLKPFNKIDQQIYDKFKVLSRDKLLEIQKDLVHILDDHPLEKLEKKVKKEVKEAKKSWLDSIKSGLAWFANKAVKVVVGTIKTITNAFKGVCKFIIKHPFLSIMLALGITAGVFLYLNWGPLNYGPASALGAAREWFSSQWDKLFAMPAKTGLSEVGKHIAPTSSKLSKGLTAAQKLAEEMLKSGNA